MNLDLYDSAGFDRGAGRGKEALWLLLRSCFFLPSALPGSELRRTILRAFGAKVGRGVVVKPQVKVTFPWRLTVGDHSWLGEEAWLLNLAPITVGANVCISQRVFLCTGNHDWSRPTFDLMAKPIVIEDGVWICANAFVGPGVTVGRGAVVTAGSVVTRDLPAGMICAGNPCVPVKPRNPA